MTELAPETMGRARLFVLFDALEEDLRSVLREHVSPYVQEEQFLGARADLARQRAEDDGIAEPSPDQLVSYLDFADGFGLINRHCEMVPASVAELVKASTPKLEALVPVRNRVMHIRPLDPDDPDLAVRFCTDLLDSPAELMRLRQTAEHLISDPTWTPLVSFASPKSDAVLHNLPLPDFDETGFIGRTDERRLVRELLAARRYPVITLLGEGGNGKTALGVQVLYDLVDTPDPPFEVILWTSLKTERLTGRGVEEIAGRARDLLGMTHDLGHALDEEFTGSLDDLAAVLHGTMTLVVIDNLESASSDEVLRLVDRLPPETMYLLTSRVGLGQLERRVPIGPLDDRAAAQLFRKLASRRGIEHLATLPPKKLDEHLGQLRYSPLAIRWYIEAIDAGAQPQDLLRDQTELLRFCMETIYRDLSPEASALLDALFASNSPTTVNDLAVISDLPADALRSAVHELQRRSFVDVAASSDGIAQVYELAASTRDYLGSVAPPAEESLSTAEHRADEIRKAEERRQLDEARNLLAPRTITVSEDRYRPVAYLLREALSKPRREVEASRELINQANSLEPEYFEVHRVQGFVESRENPELARQAYERAYELAPPDAKPKVAFFFAPHLSKTLNELPEADRYAAEAHDAFGVAETAHRLAQIRMYRERFDEARALLEQARRTVDSERTRVIVETECCRLAKRHCQHLINHGRRSDQAFALGAGAMREAWAYFDLGVADRRFFEAAIDLASETVLSASHLIEVHTHREPLIDFLEALDKRTPAMTSQDTGYLRQHLRRLAATSSCTPDVRAYIGKIEVRLSPPTAKGAGDRSGVVKKFSFRAGFGTISCDDHEEPVRFSRSAVKDANECAYLERGTPVSFRLTRTPDGIEAVDLSIELADQIRRGVLKNRKGIVTKVEFHYLFVRDYATEMGVYVPRTSFALDDEWELTSDGDELTYDIELGPKSPRAVKRSVRLAAGGPRGDRRSEV